MLKRSDVLAALGFAVLGGILGAWVLFQTGALYFYQAYMPEMIYSACGFGFVHPAVTPKGISDFLSLKVTSFNCGLLDSSETLESRGVFLTAHFYLASAVAVLWRCFSIDYRGLWPLVSLLVGAYACGCYVLLRLFYARLPAMTGAVILTLSPVMLSMVVYLRDYGKAPFFVWGIVFLVSTARASTLLAAILRAALAGVVVGIGYGFRSDVMVLLPIGLLFLAISFKSRTWIRCVGACVTYPFVALLLASPMLASSGAGGAAFLVMQGMSEPFRDYLSLGVAPYVFGQRYSDELVLSSIASELRATDPKWDISEGIAFQSVTQSITRSGGYVRSWLPAFSGDIATQAVKSAAWIVGFPALVAPGRLGLDPGIPVRSGPRAAQFLSRLYNLLGWPWIPPVFIIGLIVFFWDVDSSSPREALALSLMLGALAFYPVVQFSVRHIFHLEFIWVLAFLALVSLPARVAAMRCVPLRFVAAVVIFAGAILAVRGCLVTYQDRRLADLFDALLSHPRELVADHPAATFADGKVSFSIPLPDKYRSLTEGHLDSMTTEMGASGLQSDVRAAADRLLVTLNGSACPSGNIKMSLHYTKHDKVWQPFDEEIVIDESDRSGSTMVLVPAFYRPSQYLSSIDVPGQYAGCFTRIERVSGPTSLPIILTAVLSTGWQQRSLHRGFGGFPVHRP